MLLALKNYPNTQDSSLQAVHKTIFVQNRVCYVNKAEGLTLQLVGTRTVIHVQCIPQDKYTFCMPTTAQKLDTKVDHHTATLLHVSAYFGNLQGCIRQKTQICQIMS
jgi:hypothetical protein